MQGEETTYARSVKERGMVSLESGEELNVAGRQAPSREGEGQEADQRMEGLNLIAS